MNRASNPHFGISPQYTYKNKAQVMARKYLPNNKPCERLSSLCKGRIEKHHDDYDKPLDVIYLCQSHHKKRHKQITYNLEPPYVLPKPNN